MLSRIIKLQDNLYRNSFFIMLTSISSAGFGFVFWMLAAKLYPKDDVVVILGDNIFQDSIREDVRSFIDGGRIFLKEVPDANRFGVAELDGDRVVGIEEKPEVPKSNYAVTGLYMYDGEVFDVISMLEPSGRGELEITDVNNYYINQRRMGYRVLDGCLP